MKKNIKQLLYNINELMKSDHKILNIPALNYNYKFEESAAFDRIDTINLADKTKFKFVGAVNYKNYIYFVPNNVNYILKLDINTKKIKKIEFKDDNKSFKWTGGCEYNDKIYFFPRTSNYLLTINPNNDEIELINLNINYKNEHHYGGVVTNDGIIYQPPRNNNTIIKIDLNNMHVDEIKISSNILKYNYISGKLHPNGLLYFLPETNEKVMVFDPKTQKICFIGKKIDSMTFDVALAPNGNLYGFSSYLKGILKIDVKNNNTSMICTEISPGSYGSKLACNGKIYNIPGNGSVLYEFDPEKDKVKEILKIENDEVKYAGGCIAENGNLYCAPANSDKIMIIEFKNKKKMYVNDFPFMDNY